MFTIREIRLWNARYLAEEKGGIAGLSEVVERTASQIGQVIGLNPSKGIGGKLARLIEKKNGKPEAWLDAPHPDLWLKIQREDWRKQLPATVEGTDDSKQAAAVSEKREAYLSSAGYVRYIDLYKKLDTEQRAAVIHIMEVMAADKIAETPPLLDDEPGEQKKQA